MTVDATCGPAELRVDQRGEARWITLDRPESMNSLSPRLIDGLHRAIVEAQRDRAVRAIVVTGAGRAFCAGADLKAALALPGEGDEGRRLATFLEQAQAMMNALEASRVPTVAAVNGIALAGGLELALCCDLIVAQADARIGDGHLRYGQLPGGGGSVRLPRRVGLARAKHLMYTAELWSAEQLLHWGLVAEVAPVGRLTETVDALLARIVRHSPLALERLKRLLDDGWDQPPAAALRAEIVASEAHAHSFDRNEGLDAFAQKRTPAYRGH